MKRKTVLLLLIWMFTALTSMAQHTRVNIGVPLEENTNSNELLQKITSAKSDTAKVNLLLRLSHYYWHKRSLATKRLDSCVSYSNEAYKLSHAINYKDGEDDALFMLCKTSVEKNDISSAKTLLSKVGPEERIRLLLVISEYYVFMPGADDAELDHALPSMNEAEQISRSIHSDPWQYECLMLLGKYYFKRGDIKNGKLKILQIINSCHKKDDVSLEAHYWSELGLYMPENDSTFRDKIRSHTMAYQFFIKAGKIQDAAYSLRDISELNLNHKQADTAEKQMLQVIAMLHQSNARITFSSYTQLVEIYKFKGEYPKALTAALNALNTVKPGQDDRRAVACEYLADIYSEMGQINKSLPFYQVAFDFATSRQKNDMYIIAYRLVVSNINLGRTKEALKMILAFSKKYPAAVAGHKQLIAACFGQVYTALNNYNAAEKYYLQMIALDKKVQDDFKKQLWDDPSIGGTSANFIIGNFYAGHGKFKEAEPYLLKSLNTPNTQPSAKELRDIHYLLFETDSASGRYLSAINHFRLHKRINDSLFNATKSQQIAELQVRYDIKEKEQRIGVLNSESAVQRSELRRANLLRNITIVGSVLSLIIALLAYNGYRNKQRGNLLLKSKQAEINAQNMILKNLVTEKDWLLKEVHHRVKNNLQIVMSLLSTQSAYLENTAALDAIADSRNRVQAISLIHQKLYSTNNVASIDVSAYVSDLVNYLREGLDTAGRSIRFEQLIEPIKIDLVQAVPLGLILNEAITNAIKYAFEEKGGVIGIALQFMGIDVLLLTITDNGKGLPKGFEIKDSTTLGMEMMKALSKQLGGDFNISSNQGVTISVEFQIQNPLTALQ